MAENKSFQSLYSEPTDEKDYALSDTEDVLEGGPEPTEKKAESKRPAQGDVKMGVTPGLASGETILNAFSNVLDMGGDQTEEEQAEEVKKKADELQKSFQQIREQYNKNPGKFEIMLEDMDEKFRPVAAMLLGKPETAIAQTELLNKNIEMRNKLAKNIREQYIQQWETSSGQFDRGAAEAEAERRTTRMEPSRQGLDTLLEQGPTQVDKFEIPDRDRQILARTISAAVANAFSQIGTAFSPDPNLAAAARATTRPAAADIMTKTAAMINTDIEQTAALNRKVELMNVELMDKYKGDVVAATQEFDRRADLAERTYMKMKKQEIKNIMQRYDQYKSVAMQMKEANIQTRGKIAQMEQQTMMANISSERQRKMFNATQINQMRRVNQRRADQFAMMRAKRSRASQRANVPQDDMVKYITAMSIALNIPEADLRNVENASSDLLLANPGIANDPRVRTQTNTYTNSLMRQIQNALKNEDIDQEQFSTIVRNFVTLAGTGKMPKTFTKEIIMSMAESEFEEQAGKLIGPSIPEEYMMNSPIAPLVGRTMIRNWGGKSIYFLENAGNIPMSEREDYIKREGRVKRVLQLAP